MWSFPAKDSGGCCPSPGGGGSEELQSSFSGVLAAVVTNLSLLPLPAHLPVLLPPQVSWLGEEPVAGVWSEKGQVEVFALRRLLQVVDDPQALAAFLRDEQARTKPIFAFAGHMGEGFALDWSPRVPGESLGYALGPGVQEGSGSAAGVGADSREGTALGQLGPGSFPTPQGAC